MGTGPRPSQQNQLPLELFSALGFVVAKVWESAIKDIRLVMDVADEDLISLVNTQNHKNKEVMGVLREWVGFLLKHNIHWVARRTQVNPN